MTWTAELTPEARTERLRRDARTMRLREALDAAVGRGRLEALERRVTAQEAQLEADHLPWLHAHVARIEREHAELLAQLAAVGSAGPVAVPSAEGPGSDAARRWRRPGRRRRG